MIDFGFVQHVKTATLGAALTSDSISPTVNVQQGHTLLMVVSLGSSRNLSSASDSQGNTYNIGLSTGTVSRRISIVKAYMATALTTSDTITFNRDAQPGAWAVQIAEYAGLVPTSTQDKSAGQTGTAVTTLTTGGSGVLTQAKELVFSAVGASVSEAVDETGFTEPAGFTERYNAGVSITIADKLTTDTTSFTVQWTWPNSATASIAFVTYRLGPDRPSVNINQAVNRASTY